MFEDKLNSNLTDSGYHRLDSNAQGIYLYYRAEESQVSVISIIHAIHGDEITPEQYSHILGQIKTNFSNTYPTPIKLLNLMLTLNPDRVKHLSNVDSEASHWVVDMDRNRLMIYETQAGDFSGLNRMLEQLLDEEQQEKEQNYANWQQQGDQQSPFYHASDSYEVQRPRTVQFTMMNTIIIAVNLLAYVITHFTNAFGTPSEMFYKGALSWYCVVKGNEYYRFITAMFMHANLSHIFGNMLVLFFLGINLERALGKWKYLFIYFGSGILAGIASISYNMWKEHAITSIAETTFGIGASGAIFGVVGALLFIILINRGRQDGISAGQVLIFTGLNIYNGIIDKQIDQAAHVGGFIAGFLLAFVFYQLQRNKGKNQGFSD
jgi:Uncharacterized membrane protein (homolog of Drosophila rhomboid)